MLNNLSLIHRLKARKPFFIVTETSLNKAMHVKNWGKVAPETRRILFDKFYAGNCVVAAHNGLVCDEVWNGWMKRTDAMQITEFFPKICLEKILLFFNFETRWKLPTRIPWDADCIYWKTEAYPV